MYFRRRYPFRDGIFLFNSVLNNMLFTSSVKARSERLWFAAALLFAIVAIFTNLGNEGIYAAQEGRTAIILRNMFRTHDFCEMIVEHGVPYEKPIGHYWLCLPTAWFFGLAGDAFAGSVELAIRIPSALCALLTVLFAGLLAKRIYGWRTGCVAMMVLCTMSNFDKLARLGHIDMPLAASFMAAMYFLYVGYAEKHQGNAQIYLFYVALGAGMLLKGPLVLLLAGLVIAGLMLMRGRRWYEVPKELRLPGGIAIFLLIALPWYIYECIHSHGAFFEEFFIRQNFSRFTGDAAVYRKSSPFWHYLPKLFAGALPWSILTAVGVLTSYKRILRPRFSAGTKFLLFWFLPGFIFFSFSSVKRVDYLLPLFPAFAILTAKFISDWCEKLPAVPRKRWLVIWCILAAVLTAALVLWAAGVPTAIGQAVIDGKVSFFTDRDGMSIVMISNFIAERLPWLAAATLAVLVVAFLIGRCLEKGRFYPVFAMAALIVLALFLSYHMSIEPGTDRMKTVKPFAAGARKLIPADEEVVYVGDFNTEMIFFMDRAYHLKVERKDRWVIASPEAAQKLNAAAPAMWKEHLRTVEDHQYPAVLLERLTAEAPLKQEPSR